MPQPHFDSPHLDWNYPKILEIAGGSPAALRELLHDHGLPAPNDAAVYQWRWRKTIPADWLPNIVWAVLKSGKARLNELLVRRRVAP